MIEKNNNKNYTSGLICQDSTGYLLKQLFEEPFFFYLDWSYYSEVTCIFESIFLFECHHYERAAFNAAHHCAV